MSKKIVISFSAEPIVGDGFTYNIQINGVDLVYPSGIPYLNLMYQANGGTDPLKVEKQNNVSLTINATLAFLNANYSNPILTYSRVNNTIEVDIKTDAETVVYIGSLNTNISIDTVDITNITYVNLKYFFEYKNKVGDIYLCEIFKNNYNGEVNEISGTVIIEKGTVNNHLDPVRGGGLTLKLEANTDLTLEDLYSENEQDFTVKLYKNNKIVFRGYLNPDGVYQDYVRDQWIISLDCVDGLGALSNLSFVQSNGLQFNGKMLAIDIIYNCLKRTGILMPINTSINILYDGLTDSDDVLSSIYFNADRYIKKDNDTIMSCEEVLKSILDIFKACITQVDGEWYIYKPNEIFIQPYVKFRRFDTANHYLGNKTVNLNKVLGSQIDGFYPHHCTGNQKIEIKGSVSCFRIGYKYGLVSGLLENPKLLKNGNLLDYDGWNIIDPFILINDPLKTNGFFIKNQSSLAATNLTVQSNNLPVAIDDDLTLSIDFYVNSEFGSSFVKFKIQHGIYYLDYTPKDSQTPIDDAKNAVWSTNSSKFFVIYLTGKVGTFNIQLPKILSNSNLTVAISTVSNLGINSTTLIQSLDIKPSQSSLSVIEGEFHTVQRKNRPSSIVKENQTVFNGDNASIVYDGAIFDENKNPTSAWNRVNSFENLPILQIAAEEELRISQRPTKIFTGDIYGFMPYLSFITINNVGKFMPIEWSYDTKTNITTCKQLELFVAELTDIDYKFTVDLGETVKPTIKS